MHAANRKTYKQKSTHDGGSLIHGDGVLPIVIRNCTLPPLLVLYALVLSVMVRLLRLHARFPIANSRSRSRCRSRLASVPFKSCSASNSPRCLRAEREIGCVCAWWL